MDPLSVGSVASGTLPLVFDNGGGLTTSVTLLDMDGGATFGGTAASTQPTAGSTTSTTMQDGSPKPQSLYSLSEAYLNDLAGSSASRNALLFAFSQPLTTFGGWFGDVETRTESGGTPAVIRLFDPAGAQIGADYEIDPMPSDPSFDQTQCGAPVDDGFNGCGNEVTRWIGFTADNATPVSHMMVIVGDDDTSPGSNDGNGERLSFMGASTCTPMEYDAAVAVTSPPVTVAAGDQFTYNIDVSNDATMDFTDSMVTFSLPTDVGYVSHVAPAGWNCTTPAVGVRVVILCVICQPITWRLVPVKPLV